MYNTPSFRVWRKLLNPTLTNKTDSEFIFSNVYDQLQAVLHLLRLGSLNLSNWFITKNCIWSHSDGLKTGICLWENCGYNFQDDMDRRMHMMFHIHHAAIAREGEIGLFTIFKRTNYFAYSIGKKCIFDTRWTESESQHLSMETYGPKFDPKLTPVCPKSNIDSKLKETYMLHYREPRLCTRNHHDLMKSERCIFSSLELIRKWFGHLLSKR